MSGWSDVETDDPLYADRRNFYKVEKWRRDGLRVDLMLYAGNNLDKARRVFDRAASGSAYACWTSGHGIRRSSEHPARRGAALRPGTAKLPNTLSQVIDFKRGPCFANGDMERDIRFRQRRASYCREQVQQSIAQSLDGYEQRAVQNEAVAYLSALSAVAIESLAIKAAPHQFDPGRPGLIGVLALPVAV